MRLISYIAFLFICVLTPSLQAQVNISGLADFELRMAGDDSSPYINQTPDPELSLYTPNLRLLAFADISEQWFVQATLQADHYTGKELSDLFFSVFNINWTPDSESGLLLTAGRFVTPYGSYTDRFLSIQNPFVHLPLTHAAGLAVSKKRGFLGAARQYPTTIQSLYGPDEFGMTMVYQRMYSQGLQFRYEAGESGWLQLNLAATTAPASSHADYGVQQTPSLIGRMSVQPVIWAKAGISFSRGAFLQNDASLDTLLIYDQSSYTQNLIGADISLDYRYYTLNLEWNQSRWKAPYYNRNTSTSQSPITGLATIQHVSGELIVDLPFLVGSYVATRYEYMNEGDIELYERDASRNKINESVSDWTFSRTRLELAAGYKLDRNILLKASYLFSDDNGPVLDDNVFSIQLSVLF